MSKNANATETTDIAPIVERPSQTQLIEAGARVYHEPDAVQKADLKGYTKARVQAHTLMRRAWARYGRQPSTFEMRLEEFLSKESTVADMRTAAKLLRDIDAAGNV